MTEAQTPDTRNWERVHPLSPLARFWVALLIILFTVVRNFAEDLFEGRSDIDDIQEGFGRVVASLSLLAWLGLLLLVVLVLGGMFWSWWFTRYLVTDDAVRLRQGYVFRKDKQARLDRVQSIEISQPFLARLLGMAELRFDVADSGDSALHLQYLRKSEAEDLRARLLGRRQELLAEESVADGAGDSDARGTDAEGAPESREADREPTDAVHGAPSDATIAKVGTGRAVLATLLGPTGVFFLLVLVVSVFFAIFLPEVGGFVFIPAALSLVSGVWSSINSTANFQVMRTRDGLKLQYGLTSTRTQTLPLGRIQAVGIEQPLLWRIPGWFRVRINTAGLGSDSVESARRILLPVGAGQDLMNILPHVVETAEEGGIDGFRLRAALEGRGPGHGFVVAPRRSRWLDPLAWRRNGYANTEDLLLLRGGWMRRRLSVVPHARTQSASISSSPLERRLALAKVRLDSVGGSVTTSVEHLDVDDARRMIREQAERAAFARRLTRPAAQSDVLPNASTKDETHYD